MTDEKTTPENPEEPEFAYDDVTDTAVREPATSAYGEAAPAAEPVHAETADYSGLDSWQPESAAGPAFADEPTTPDESGAPDAAFPAAHGEDGAPPQYGVGPFSLREVTLLGVWALAFLFSFFPLYVDTDVSRLIGGGATVWTSGIDWVLGIAAPTVAVFLIVLRRFSPQGIRRFGSLGIDQFASVAFSVSALVWLSWLWGNIARGIDSGFWLSSWVVWVEVVLMLAGVALTVVAPFIPPFHEDFLHRHESTAHRVARAARPVVARPISDARYTMAAPSVDPDPAPFGDPIDESEPAPIPAPAHQAFWALAPVERDVVDENGIPLFRIGPTAWALVIEDRGDSFVVRHEDGRIGYLTDVSGVTRG
ncbi:hypothetical protein AB3M83_10240 [Microbacterium sp. 179-B 1A2 NHS]|uniref:hypothetical protein n=1 Tax=Microbacterium sp. 179-B 1A2 NHS TaxID=3142383 RepID=UPI0039A09BEC